MPFVNNSFFEIQFTEHTFTHLKYTIQWVSAHLRSCASIHAINYRKFSSPAPTTTKNKTKKNTDQQSLPIPPQTSTSGQTLIHLSIYICPFWTRHISGLTHPVLSCLASFTEHVFKVHPCGTKYHILFLSMCHIPLYGYNHSLFTDWLVDGFFRFFSFYLSATVNNSMGTFY